MRPAALALGAALLAVGCGRRQPPRSPLAPDSRTLSASVPIRVGIVVDRDSSTVSATGRLRILDGEGNVLGGGEPGSRWTVRPGGGGALEVLTPGNEQWAVVGPVIVQAETDALVLIAGRPYRGDAVVLRGTAGVTVVNRVAIEEYLRSVVALELGFRAASDREAVKAQAVAARTYALRYMGRREALGFDVFPTDADQVYGGQAAEMSEVDEAVRATAGEILTWEGRPIEALFHSTCGWSTEPSDQVWLNREPVPYLQAVSDRSGDGPEDYYCRISPRFRWREEWGAQELAAVLARTLPALVSASPRDIGRVLDVRVVRTTATGRVAELEVSTTAGTWTLPGYRIREVLRTAGGRQLLSTMFQVHVQRESDTLSRLVLAGGGFGHGVGMCQFGAVGRARAGRDYRSILAAYYQGTALERLY